MSELNAKELSDLIQFDLRVLTPELLKPKWAKINRASGINTTGHCYAASEALFYLLGGKEKPPYRPKRIKIDNGSHWFLQHQSTGDILDPTSTQFPNGINYNLAIGCGFMQQSIRSQVIIDRVQSILKNTLL